MKWKILNKYKVKDLSFKDVIQILLENRGVKNEKQIQDFLAPRLSTVTSRSVGIDIKELDKSVKRIKEAIKNKEQIVILGDYDADGICATAIIWELLNSQGARVTPYIPHRVEEGYGLSINTIKNLKSQIKDIGLIITVDNGILANEAVDYINKDGIDVIITDHHTKLEKLPNAYSIIHTTKLCGAGIAWILSKELGSKDDYGLVLAGIATIADLMPLVGKNRAIVKHALSAVRKTSKIGLLEIFKEAGLERENIGSYEISYIVTPRINASGRIEKAMDSLRLLCTSDKSAAKLLAEKLGRINKKRQRITEEALNHARSKLTRSASSGQKKNKLIFVYDKSYEQGIIGLVAGKLVDEYYLPAIALSKGEKHTKASARSISGFNIIDFIRNFSDLLVDAGGHPMAAGFTVETKNLSLLEKKLTKKANKLLDKELLIKELKVDCEIPLSIVNLNFFKEVEKLEPFGMGNPTPTFLTRDLEVKDIRQVGMGKKHLKLFLRDEKSGHAISAIGFNLGKKAKEIEIGSKINVVFTISVDEWNGSRRLQLKLKDIN